jgi:hypothetical protein
VRRFTRSIAGGKLRPVGRIPLLDAVADDDAVLVVDDLRLVAELDASCSNRLICTRLRPEGPSLDASLRRGLPITRSAWRTARSAIPASSALIRRTSARRSSLRRRRLALIDRARDCTLRVRFANLVRVAKPIAFNLVTEWAIADPPTLEPRQEAQRLARIQRRNRRRPPDTNATARRSALLASIRHVVQPAG